MPDAQGDKFTAVWVSHSSIGDFLKCRRSYFLKNVYKNPATGKKIMLIQPPLALGQAVHAVVESLSSLHVEKRFETPLLDLYETAWQMVSGRKGGFSDKQEEEEYKDRGRKMLQRVIDHPGPLLNKAVKINESLPHYFLSAEENIILCGKIDWLEYCPEDDSVKILDFKTGKNNEDEDSLQLAIYCHLVMHTQKRKVSGVKYWYLDRDNEPIDKALPDMDASLKRILDVAIQIKRARLQRDYVCLRKGCFACRPFEAIIRGEAELIGSDEHRRELYVLPVGYGNLQHISSDQSLTVSFEEQN